MRYIRWPVFLAAVTSAVLASGSLAAGYPARAAVNLPARPAAAPRLTTDARPVLAGARRGRAPRTWTVTKGQTLSAIAARAYGSAELWPALWWVNKARVPNPDLIEPGQHLRLSSWHPHASWLLRAGIAADGPRSRPAARRHASGSGHRTWKVTYGYPYRCGDGDNDGWDRPCTYRRAVSYRARRAGNAIRYSSAGYGRILSFSQIERLWMSAGGPAWAAARAARIAECESGGNIYARNPSGASGVWQILGQVVSGNVYNPYVNALNAVAKFRASGQTFAQWVCQG